ncbi:type II secretion system F family protein [Kitasatospora sp. NPDC002227]|uniref:type II secretion system F family protein n=1 Tax=Kitasatospora sp. NPDC002227 TaxID=3154773 RepID=UPI00331E1A61
MTVPATMADPDAPAFRWVRHLWVRVWWAGERGPWAVRAALLCCVLVLVGSGLSALREYRRRTRTVRRIHRLGTTVSRPCGAGWFTRLRARRPRWLVAELLLLPLGLVLARAARSPVPLAGAAVALLPLRRWRQRRRVTAEARRRASAVIELCEGLAAELRSGATPEQALHTVTSRGSSLRRGLGDGTTARLTAGRYGGNIPAALRELATLPGGQGGAALAACWHLTTESGVGLAAGLDQVADALRAERSLAEEIAGELAAPRATIVVLAALPSVGLLLGAALGARPVQVLLHTPAGLVCLLLGVALEALGLVWTGRIIRAVTEPAGWRGPGSRVGGRWRARTSVTGAGPGSGARAGGSASAAGRRLPRPGPRALTGAVG